MRKETVSLLNRVVLKATREDIETNEISTANLLRPATVDNWPLIAMSWWDYEDDHWRPIRTITACDAYGEVLGTVERDAWDYVAHRSATNPHDVGILAKNGQFRVSFTNALERFREKHHSSYDPFAREPR